MSTSVKQANLSDELTWRGLIQQASDLEAISKLKDCSFYCGFDPTAPSLQVGNMVPMMAMAHIARISGMTPIVLFGGATGAIGDPSGRNSERKLIDRSAIESNVSKHQAQFRKIFERLGIRSEFVNNFDWTKDVNVLDFMRDIGKHFPMTYMLSKETVKSRIHGDGISYTEFSYMLLQAFDFAHLFEHRNCKLQIGGNEQWGNITAGLELIRRKGLGEAQALTFPLLTDSQGKKLGKSEGGTVWLDAEMTSPYRFHQYWINLADEDATKCLRFLTVHSRETIESAEAEMRSAPEKRATHNLLADTMCELVHGKEALVLAKRSAEVLFGGSTDGLSESELLEIFKDVPSSTLPAQKITQMSVIDLFVESGLSKSKGEARRLIENGGAYLNNNRVSDVAMKTPSNLGNLLVLRSGKKNYHLVRKAG